jgi:putative MATE family efflux protein
MGLNSSKIFGDKKISRVLLKFAIPAIISLLVLELYNVVDALFVGRYVGANAIGALTIAFPIQRFIIAIGMLIAVGASTYVARQLGKQNAEGLKNTIINAFVLTIVTISVVSIIIFAFKNSIIMGLGSSNTLFPLANAYISIIVAGAIFQCLSTVACYIMTALGNTKITLFSNLVGFICNVILDYLLVVLLHKGIAGAAFATVISQIAAFCVVLYKFREVKKAFNIQFTMVAIKNSFSRDVILGIVGIGFSTFVIEISDAVCTVILNNLLVYEGGDKAVIIIGVITKVSMFMFITIIGISSAMQPIVAYNYGAKQYSKMKEALKISIITVTIASLSFWVVLMGFSNQIIGVFLREQDILAQAVIAFRICISVIPAIGVYYICIYYFQAINESKKSFLLSIYRQIIIFIPVAIILVKIFGIMGAWVAYPVSDLICSLSSIYFINKATEEKYDEKLVLGKVQVLNN